MSGKFYSLRKQFTLSYLILGVWVTNGHLILGKMGEMRRRIVPFSWAYGLISWTRLCAVLSKATDGATLKSGDGVQRCDVVG